MCYNLLKVFVIKVKEYFREEYKMGKVTKDMGILDIVQQYPEAVAVFQKYGMGCLGCAAARFENLEAGARVHGFDPDEMVADINALIGEG